jgi:glycosyltransferase involved in cell wall biosynthesis
MHILQVIETGGPGGAETVFARLAAALRTEGHTVTAVVGSDDWLARQLRRSGCPVVVHSGHGTLDLAFVRLLRRLMRDADVVHSHLFGATVYAAIAAAGTGVPVVGTLHGHADLQGDGLRLAVKRAVLRHGCARLTAVSDNLARHAAELLAFPAARVRVVHNGVAANGVAANGSADPGIPAALTTESVVQSGPVVGALGNIRPSKDYPTLLRALALLVDRHPNVRLEIAGAPDDSGLYESIQLLADSLALTSRVTFRGFVESPATFLAGCDVFALSSSHEGFSLATVEAMLAGVPVVATRSGGPEEILRDAETGLLVPTANPAALAAAIADTLENRDASQRRTLAARTAALERFTVDAMLRSYLNIYRDVTELRAR